MARAALPRSRARDGVTWREADGGGPDGTLKPHMPPRQAYACPSPQPRVPLLVILFLSTWRCCGSSLFWRPWRGGKEHAAISYLLTAATAYHHRLPQICCTILCIYVVLAVAARRGSSRRQRKVTARLATSSLSIISCGRTVAETGGENFWRQRRTAAKNSTPSGGGQAAKWA